MPNYTRTAAAKLEKGIIRTPSPKFFQEPSFRHPSRFQQHYPRPIPETPVTPLDYSFDDCPI